MQSQQPTQRYGAKITTVDPSQGLVEFALKDGSVGRALIASIPAAFRWPQVGENWIVCKMNGTWYLESMFYTTAATPVTDYLPGEVYLNGEQVRLADGQYVHASATQPPITVSGRYDDGSALRSLIAALVELNLVIDQTTA